MVIPEGTVPAKWVPIAIVCMLSGSAPNGRSFYKDLFDSVDKQRKGREFSLRPLTKEELQARVFLYCFVTIWLDSGKDQQNPNINNPQKRHLLSTHPETGESFLSILNKWKDRHPPSLSFSDDGKVSVIYEEPILTLPTRPGLSTYAGLFGGQKKPTSPQGIALYWFVRLLDSPGAHCLARCANRSCERFFLYKKPQGKLKKGTYCNSCKTSYFSEMARSRRLIEKARLVKSAAEVWSKCGGKAEAVANKMNAKQNGPTPVTRKWVVQNTAAIEQYLAGTLV